MIEAENRITFKPVQNADIFALWQIYLYYIRNSTATFQIQDIDMDQMKQLVIPDDLKYYSFSIYMDGAICGYASFHRYREREAFAQTAEVTIYLKQDCSGHGIGFKAVQMLEPLAQKSGIHTLLALVCQENTASIRLFEKCGYRQQANLKDVGCKFGRYLDLVILQKLL